MTGDDSDLQQRIDSEDYGPGTPCSQCGNTLDDYCPEWTEYCMRHAGKRTEPLILELEALADKLESPEGKTQLRDKTYCEYDETDTVTEIAEQCAQELREVIEQHE